ncbi:hypothetical protein [Anthocerotibacter panamensis]|uniref:hypothetical protein n=1 Tax=Anthocerotibacter panamensis TaxID=2857077 RepID=UPI001C4082CD|nr:hypothetical protein [Anthocerotibacter panamensis]
MPTDALHALLNRWERALKFAPAVLLLDCASFSAQDLPRQEALLTLLQKLNAPLLLVTEERLTFLKNPLPTFEVPRLTPQEHRAVWQTSLGPVAQELNGQVDRLVAQFNLTTPAIQAICREAQSQPDKDRASP